MTWPASPLAKVLVVIWPPSRSSSSRALTATSPPAPVEPLSSMTPEPYRAVFVGRAGHVPGRADTPLTVERDRRVDGGVLEQVTIRSYSREPMTCHVEVLLEADFADIFEVKEGRARGKVLLWGEVTDDRGAKAVARLRGPEGYTWTALTALAIDERVLAGDVQAGFQTPGGLYGPDFVLMPGVQRKGG